MLIFYRHSTLFNSVVATWMVGGWWLGEGVHRMLHIPYPFHFCPQIPYPYFFLISYICTYIIWNTHMTHPSIFLRSLSYFSFISRIPLFFYPYIPHPITCAPLLSPKLRNVAEEKASGSAANQRRKVLMLNVFISSQAVPCFGILLPSIAILPSDATLNVLLKRIWSCTNL